MRGSDFGGKYFFLRRAFHRFSVGFLKGLVKVFQGFRRGVRRVLPECSKALPRVCLAFTYSFPDILGLFPRVH